MAESTVASELFDIVPEGRLGVCSQLPMNDDGPA